MSRTLAVVAAVVVLLFIPLPESKPGPAPERGGAFAWQADSVWHALEAGFVAARAAGCEAVAPPADAALDRVESRLVRIASGPVAPEVALLDSLESDWFAASMLVAACPAPLDRYLDLARRLRVAIKRQSAAWSVADRPARDRLYRALYGNRAALEEVLLQHPGAHPALLPGTPEPSAAPSVELHGVRIHSGDLLVSRGGAPTSALIARGNDYPGNFSHVALVHVDSAGAASTIEAHIEGGVSIASAEQYLADRKLRIMVLRPRADLAVIAADPMLPHRAATAALTRARAGHIPYDFAMDYRDAGKLFCSEVASSVYAELGLTLWTGLSTISDAGLRRWLWGFGVRHFETQEPSDLEYDPQLVVVAEWRDPEALRADHLDNAVVDVMLEGAARGNRLGYPWYQLPVARLLKGWSWLMVATGRTGPVPEGMSAAAALRNQTFSAHQRALAARLDSAARAFAQREGYPPPYWQLVALARELAVSSDPHPTPR